MAYKRWLIILGALLALVFPAWAGAQGTSGAQPMKLISVTIDSGQSVPNASDIPLKPKLRFRFDKAVVGASVWEQNSQCFTLWEGERNIPISVTKADNPQDAEQKQTIFVEPVEPLMIGTTYMIKVAPILMAQNGVSQLGGTTNGQGGLAFSFQTNTTGDLGQAAPSVDGGQSISYQTWLTILTLLLLGGWIAGEVWAKKRGASRQRG